jgi:hypothetical protein
MSNVRLRRAMFCCVTAVISLTGFNLFAQSDNGSIVGYVKDPTGATIPKAKVALKNEATGIVKQTTGLSLSNW